MQGVGHKNQTRQFTFPEGTMKKSLQKFLHGKQNFGNFIKNSKYIAHSVRKLFLFRTL